MHKPLYEAYEHALQALTDSHQNECDPDAIFRLTWRTEHLTCILALLTGQHQALGLAFPHLQAILMDLTARWKNQPGPWILEEYMQPSPVFRSMGLFGGFQTRADATSADGSILIGSGIIRDDGHLPVVAIHWTADQGLVNLGTLGGFLSAAEAISADGAWVVGHSQNSQRVTDAFYWTPTEGMKNIGRTDGLRSKAYNVSSGGPEPTIVGLMATRPHDAEIRAVRWIKEKDGAFVPIDLGTLGGNIRVSHGVSADGNLIVGYSEDAQGNLEAFRWTQAEGMIGLGHLADKQAMPCQSVAYEASADGSVIIGQSTSPSKSHQAFRWTQTEGLTALQLGANTPDCKMSVPRGVSGDGKIIVGKLTDFGGPLNSRAFIWDQAQGIRSIQTILEQKGVQLTGWTLTAATHISANGQVITGHGINPNGQLEGWRVDLSSLEIAPGTSALLWSETQHLLKEIFSVENLDTAKKEVPSLMNQRVWNSA